VLSEAQAAGSPRVEKGWLMKFTIMVTDVIFRFQLAAIEQSPRHVQTWELQVMNLREVVFTFQLTIIIRNPFGLAEDLHPSHALSVGSYRSLICREVRSELLAKLRKQAIMGILSGNEILPRAFHWRRWQNIWCRWNRLPRPVGFCDCIEMFVPLCAPH